MLPWLPPQVLGLLPTALLMFGRAFTTTLTVPAGELQPATVATTLYVPLINTVLLALTGFCKLELNDAGPLQLYVAPLIVLAVNFMVSPLHTGLLLLAVGADGLLGSLNTTFDGLPVELQPVLLTVTTKFPYVPAFKPLIVT